MTTRGRDAGAILVFIVSTWAPAIGCASHPIASPATARLVSGIPASSLLFADDFDRYDPRWRQVRGQWSVVDGALRQTRDEVTELNTVFYFDPLTIADADITSEATIVSD